MTRHSFVRNCLVALFCLSLATGCNHESSAVKVESGSAKLALRAETTASEKRETILAEIGKLGDHEWAGEYYCGDGMGENISLTIAPSSGYVFEWHGCMGTYDRNFGAVTASDGRVHLSFTFENKRGGFQGIAPDFVRVSWGPRRYLVPVDEVVGFCNNVNDGQEPRAGLHGSYLLRRGDEKKAVSGLPTVPPKYRSYLLERPIEATIIAVGAFTTRPSRGDWKFKDTPVTVDAGSKQGLRPGMELVVTEPTHTVQSVTITKVDADRSQGTMTQIGEEQDGPAPGWRLSTKAPWHEDEIKDDASEIK